MSVTVGNLHPNTVVKSWILSRRRAESQGTS
ncbi:MAG: hypothetical protein JWN85_1936, partial [Gammaproteobacteria bacterium]|nr:hypothetical protein [Gammaproteobacteria bacterium]